MLRKMGAVLKVINKTGSLGVCCAPRKLFRGSVSGIMYPEGLLCQRKSGWLLGRARSRRVVAGLVILMGRFEILGARSFSPLARTSG